MNPMTVGGHTATAYATGTSAFGAALAIIVAWGAGAAGVEMPEYVVMALGVVLTGGTSFVLRFIPQKGNT